MCRAPTGDLSSREEGFRKTPASLLDRLPDRAAAGNENLPQKPVASGRPDASAGLSHVSLKGVSTEWQIVAMESSTAARPSC